jgi:acyl homoserine lactone synthase
MKIPKRRLVMASLKQQERKNPERIETYSIFIREGELVVKNLITEEEKIQAYHLRHRIFAQELEWVPQSENGLETDSYDDYAIPFGVFDTDNRMLAHIRLILAGYPFMIEKDFKLLVSSEHVIRHEGDTGETSRICVAPEARPGMVSGNFGIHRISMFLYKGVYHWSLRNNIRYIYTVVEHKVWRLLRTAGFPCKLIGEPQVMPDGTKACAVIMNWLEFEALNAEKRPDMLRWFTQYQSVLAEQQQKQLEAYSQH